MAVTELRVNVYSNDLNELVDQLTIADRKFTSMRDSADQAADATKRFGTNTNQVSDNIDNLNRNVQTLTNLNIAGTLAEGGQAYRNQAYIVGEAGPEIFVPNTAGTVLPNRSGTSSSPNIVINNSFAPGTDLRTIDQAATQIGLRVQRALRRST